VIAVITAKGEHNMNGIPAETANRNSSVSAAVPGNRTGTIAVQTVSDWVGASVLRSSSSSSRSSVSRMRNLGSDRKSEHGWIGFFGGNRRFGTVTTSTFFFIYVF